MADTAKVLRLIPKGPRYAVLTPNVKAVDDIVKTGSLEFIHEVFVFGAASGTWITLGRVCFSKLASSEGFSRANTNCSVAESIDRMAATTERALAHGLKVRGSVSCIVGSPFESSVDKKLVREIAQKMIQAGCYGVSLADTIGVGNPATIRAVIEEVMKEVPASKLGVSTFAFPVQRELNNFARFIATTHLGQG
jgi:hydroxymethylglutaryl-CoA lyase